MPGSEQLLYFAQQVIRETRLLKEHVTPRALSTLPVFRRRTGGQYDDGRGPRTVVVAQARNELKAIHRVVEDYARDHDVGLGRQHEGIPGICDRDHRKSVVAQKLRIHFQTVVTGRLNEQDDRASSGGERWSLHVVEPHHARGKLCAAPRT